MTSTTVSTMMWTASVVLALFGLGLVKANADILDQDGGPSVKLYVSALDHETIEITWNAPELSSNYTWVLIVSETLSKKIDIKTFVKLDGNIRRHVFKGLSPNKTYYVFLDCHGPNKEYITWTASSPEKVTMPGRANVTDTNTNGEVERAAQEKPQSSGKEEGAAVVTQPPTAGGVVVSSTTPLSTKPPYGHDANMVLEEVFPAQALNSTQNTSPMPTNYTGGSRGSEVAREQQKTLLKWVLITGGAGLGVIIVASILSLLCYKPLRKKREEEEDVTMRKKPSTSDAEGNGAKEGNDQGTSRHHKEVHVPPHLGIPEIGPTSNRAAGSVISWGSEFDILDNVSENIYNNDQPNMTSTGTAPTLPPPRIQARNPRPLPALPKLSALRGGASGLMSRIKNRLSGESFRHPGNRGSPADGDVYNNSNPQRVYYMSGNKPSLYQNSDLSADGGYASGSSTYDNNISNDTSTAGDDIYLNSDLALRGNRGYVT